MKKSFLLSVVANMKVYTMQYLTPRFLYFWGPWWICDFGIDVSRLYDYHFGLMESESGDFSEPWECQAVKSLEVLWKMLVQ